jgi:hypothetical protein
MSDAQMNWKRELQRTAECPQVDRLPGILTLVESEHVAHCARCQAEMALWKEFRNGKTSLSEAAAVQWISSELRRRFSTGSVNAVPSNVVSMASRRKVLPPRALAAAAMLVVALGIGYMAQNREPSAGGAPNRSDFYRSSRIKVTTPSGDVTSSPARLEWTPVAGASSYDVSVLEVDRTILWQGNSLEPRVALPSTVTAQFVPGKTIFWEVTARRGTAVLAQSGTERFRVALK